jgi:cytoskeleton protein RodZ
MRRFAEQTARRMAHVVITAAIAVPVWLVTRPQLALEQAPSVPLDLPAKAERAAGDDRLRRVALESQPKPVVASIAQIPLRAVPLATRLSLRFNEDSWVQVMAPDGDTVEEALLGSGDERHYAPGQVGRIILGNGDAVEVSHRGVVQDLSPYMRASIARFAVSSDGSLAPVVQ